MKKSSIYLHKIIHNPLNKKYNIIFRDFDSKKIFCLYFNNRYAKHIAMAAEGITSSEQSQFELFINLLNSLKMNVRNIIIDNSNNQLIGILEIEDIKKNIVKLNSNIGDAIVIGLITFSNISINSSLLVKNTDIITRND